jgi:EXPERA (EXPanded EBP superfamily)
MRLQIPLKRRPIDIGLLGFFIINLFFVSYVISLEQIVIRDPASFVPPIWPPRGALALIHWWEKTFDPLLWARPAWYRATIWIDVLVFGPFYAVAIYAYARGREWIRTPSLLWAGMMLSNVVIILSDELVGVHASPKPLVVVAANASWILVPLLVAWRMARRPHPFSEEMILPGE